jgi:hypothetical protein
VPSENGLDQAFVALATVQCHPWFNSNNVERGVGDRATRADQVTGVASMDAEQSPGTRTRSAFRKALRQLLAS